MCVPFEILNQCTDFYKKWYGYSENMGYSIEDHETVRRKRYCRDLLGIPEVIYDKWLYKMWSSVQVAFL